MKPTEREKHGRAAFAAQQEGPRVDGAPIVLWEDLTESRKEDFRRIGEALVIAERERCAGIVAKRGFRWLAEIIRAWDGQSKNGRSV